MTGEEYLDRTEHIEYKGEIYVPKREAKKVLDLVRKECRLQVLEEIKTKLKELSEKYV